MKRLIVCLLAACLLLAGCGGKGGEYTPTGDGLSYDEGYTGPQNIHKPDQQEQKLCLPYYPARSLNPYLCTDYTNRALFTLLYQGLFAVDRSYQVQPLLCSRYTVSEDMKSYTFYFANATFSDSTPLTAADVVASLEAARQSDFYKGRFIHITEMTPTPDGGLTVHLDTPYEDLPLLLDIPIVKADQVAADRPAGTGPYSLFATAGGESLIRRTDWWCSCTMAVTADTISLFAAESTAQIRDRFEFFELSMVCADPGSDRYVDYRCDYELWDCENGLFLYLATNADSEIFQNDILRIALTYAIDRDTITKEFYRGFARSASLPASPLSPYYSQTLADRYRYDSARFTQAVQDSNMVGSTVVFLVNSDDSLRLRVARSIKDMLEAGGLYVELKELGTNAFTEAVKARQFDLYLGQTRLSPNMDLSPFFATYGELSWGGVDDLGAYALSLQALENHGNYFTLHKQVMDQGLLCPILVRSYAIYADRGLISELSPARDSVFFYNTGKTMADAKSN